MEQIPTAEEFLKSKGCNYILQKGKLYFSDVTREDMIEFTKLHVEAALKEASEKAFAQSSRSNFTSKDRQLYGKQGLICVHLGDVSVNEDSILNSYSLDNIK